MTIEEWSQFICLGIAGAFGLFCLFDGTRRLARQAGGNASRITGIGVIIVGTLVGYAYWQSLTYAELASSYRTTGPVRELPADWGKKINPAKRETTSQGLARGTFITTGTLTPYVDASGQRKTYVPVQDDLKRRENVLATAARIQQKARSSFNEFVLWLVLGVSALIFGLCFSVEAAAKPAEDEAEPTA
jgi:hypothetical protein